jgi:O-antigen/teichoic acid export membrane protein
LFVQKLVLGYSSKIAVQVLQLFGMLIVARLLGPNVMGTVAFGLAFVSMFLFIADLGLGSAHIKLISEGRDEASCNGTFARLKIILVGLYFVAVLVFYLMQKYVFGVAFESPVQEYVILTYLVITSLGQIYSIPATTFAAKTEQAKQDIPNFVQVLIYQILRVIVAFLGYKALAQSLSNLVAVLLVLPIYLFLFRGYPIGKYDKSLAKIYFGISVPVFIALITRMIIFSSDRVILQYLTNSEEVGYYSAGLSLSQFIRLIETSAGLLFFPFFSKFIAEGEYEKINNSIRKFERFNLLLVLPMVAYVAIFANFVVFIALGGKFFKTPPILAIITISMFIAIIGLPYLDSISGKGLFKLSATICAVGMVVYLIMSFVLVMPSFCNLKGVGITLSLVITNLFTAVIFMYYTKKHISEIKILPERFLFLYGIAYSTIAYFVYNLFSFGIIGNIFASILFFIGFFGIAFLFKIITVDDWKMIMQVIDYKKMLNYLNSELKNQ